MQLTTTTREALLRAFYTYLFDAVHTSASTPERLAEIACMSDDALIAAMRKPAVRSRALRMALENARVPLTEASLTVTVAAHYDLNGCSPDRVREHVEEAFKEVLRGGILTGGLDCTVEWTLGVEVGVPA